MDDDAFIAHGGNESVDHVDFMIGSPDMDVDGLTAGGIREPLMRKGEWAFTP
jgi:aminopeptidase